MKNNMTKMNNFFSAASQAVIGFGLMVTALAIQTSLEISGTIGALLGATMLFGAVIMMLNVILACDAFCDMREERHEREKFIVYDYEGEKIVRKAS